MFGKHRRTYLERRKENRGERIGDQDYEHQESQARIEEGILSQKSAGQLREPGLWGLEHSLKQKGGKKSPENPKSAMALNLLTETSGGRE